MSEQAQPRATDNVRREWGRRVEAEYRSAALTQHLTLWLIQIGGSPDLIQDGLRIVDDELTHARMSHDVLVTAGGAMTAPIEREQLALRRQPGRALELDVLDAGVRVFCLGETVAVPLFKHLRERCTVPVARAALDRILVDEVRHRDFGWTLLDWMLEVQGAVPPEQVRARVAEWLPAMFAGLARSYGAFTDPEIEGLPGSRDEERAWGLAPAPEYTSILERTFTRDYAPRFRARGIDPEPAWASRR